MVFNEGTKCNHLSFILEGGVSIRTYSVNGKEELINNLSEGDIFGDIICFAENRNYIGHVIAEKNSIIEKTGLGFLAKILLFCYTL